MRPNHHSVVMIALLAGTILLAPSSAFAGEAPLIGTWRPKIAKMKGFTMTFGEDGMLTFTPASQKVAYQRDGDQILINPSGPSETLSILELTDTALQLKAKDKEPQEWVRVTISELLEAATGPTEKERARAKSMEELLEKLYLKDPNGFSAKTYGKLIIDNYDKGGPGLKSLLSPQMHVFVETGKKSNLVTSLRAAISEKVRAQSVR